jgi:hypothetical protein
MNASLRAQREQYRLTEGKVYKGRTLDCRAAGIRLSFFFMRWLASESYTQGTYSAWHGRGILVYLEAPPIAPHSATHKPSYA